MTFPREVWLAYAAIAGLTGLQAFLPDWIAATQPPPGVTSTIAADFMTSGAIELSRVSRDEAYAMVLVRNDSRQSARAEIRAVALDRHGNELSGLVKKDLDPYGPTPVKIQLTPPWQFHPYRDDRLPARGFVMLRVWPKDAPDSASPTLKVREIVVPQLQPSLAEMRITGIGIIAGLLVLLFGLALAPVAQSNAAIKGTPKWTPQSWSTNLAIGGALLTAILAIGGLPAQGYYATKMSYAALSTFYAAMVALAPAVYGLLRVGSVSEVTALRSYTFAAAVTVWATVGQLGTAAQVSLELGVARVFSAAAANAAAVLFWSVALFVFLYAIRAVHTYSTANGSPTPKAGGRGQEGRPTDPPTAPTEWALL